MFAEANAVNAELYPRFATAMEKYGYDWEPMTVTTEDDYILTTFHITGKTGEAVTATEGTVLVQHGLNEDAAEWVSAYGDELHFALKLVDSGFDIWMGNNRGTEYSWGHKTLDATTDNDYWNFHWGQMGLYDDKANITAIKEATGEDKISYVGYSQGTA